MPPDRISKLMQHKKKSKSGQTGQKEAIEMALCEKLKKAPEQAHSRVLAKIVFFFESRELEKELREPSVPLVFLPFMPCNLLSIDSCVCLSVCACADDCSWELRRLLFLIFLIQRSSSHRQPPSHKLGPRFVGSFFYFFFGFDLIQFWISVSFFLAVVGIDRCSFPFADCSLDACSAFHDCVISLSTLLRAP